MGLSQKREAELRGHDLDYDEAAEVFEELDAVRVKYKMLYDAVKRSLHYPTVVSATMTDKQYAILRLAIAKAEV